MLSLIGRHANNAIGAVFVVVFVIWQLAYPNDFGPQERPLRVTLPESERQMFARTLLGECGRCGDEELRWIGHVILNRLKSRRYGEEIADVVTFQRRGIYHFSTWDPRQNKLETVGAHVDGSVAFKRMLRLADGIWHEAEDPTGGAVNFYHPAAMRPIGRVPSWAKGREGITIGGAVFFR